MRIEPVFVLQPDHPLDDDGHLFFFKTIRCCLDIILCALIECRSIDALDGREQFSQSDRLILMIVRNHVRCVNTGKRMVLRVLQKARRAHGKRFLRNFEEGTQLFDDLARKCFSLNKLTGDFLVVRTVQCNTPQLVFFDKLVEYGGPQNHAGRHTDFHAVEEITNTVVVDQKIDECKAACLAAHGPAPDSRKTSTGIKRLFREIRNEPLSAGFSILLQRMYKIFSQALDRPLVGDFSLPKLIRQPEFRTGFQPSREMVPFRVILNTFFRHKMELLFERFQIARPSNLLPPGNAKDKIAEAEVLRHEIPQLKEQGWGLLEEK